MSSPAIHPQSNTSGGNASLTAGSLSDAETTPIHPLFVEEFGIVGHSTAAERLRLQVRRIGPHFRTVLLTGAAGTEKEPVARALHRLSPRADGPFLSRHATILDDNVASSSTYTLPRLMDAVETGTLFLDGLTEIPTTLQDHLLHALRRQELRPSWDAPGSLRLIVAATEDLRSMASSGLFRQELYQRLSMVEINLPSLRSRPSDIPEYIARWLQRTDARFGRRIERLSGEALERLCCHSWPGDVFELESTLNNAALRGVEPSLSLDDIPPLTAPTATRHPALTLSAKLQDVVDQHVLEVLRGCGGNKLRAAEILGISRSTLYRMLDALSVNRSPF